MGPTAFQQTQGGPDVAVSPSNPLPIAEGGALTANVPAAAGNTIIKAGPGRLARILVTAAGSGSGSVLVYDSTSGASGTIIGVIPATVAVGTYCTFDLPAALGIVVANVASGPQLTVSYY